MKSKYTQEDIQVITWLDHIRKRPGMYLGALGGYGIASMLGIYIGEIAPTSKNIEVMFDKTGCTHITNDGPGLPVTIHAKTNQPILEMLFTSLACGSKNSTSYAILSALSKYLRVVTADKDELGWVNTYSMTFSQGEVLQKLKLLDYQPCIGTSITFWPDPEIFPDKPDATKPLTNRIDELRQEFPNTKINLTI